MGWFSRDLVLLHAPSVFDFRESAGFFGPVSDVVPSTPVFEMYPIGLTTITQRLEDEGFNVRIISMTRDQIVAATYEAAGQLAALKYEVGTITKEAYEEIVARIRASLAVIAEVDAILTQPAGPERTAQLAAARQRHRSVQAQTTCAKEELQWPIAHRFGRLPRLLWLGARLLAREMYVLAFKRMRLAAYHRVSHGAPGQSADG